MSKNFLQQISITFFINSEIGRDVQQHWQTVVYKPKNKQRYQHQHRLIAFNRLNKWYANINFLFLFFSVVNTD